MKTRLLNLWETLRTSYWFLPSLMSVGAMFLAFVMIAIDTSLELKMADEAAWQWLKGAEGARAVLSVIAGSTITVAGVVFSITIVALTLASSQYGPRLLRNFMRKTGNQVTLGTFIATFLYCLLVLGMVNSGSDADSVPYLSVTLGVALAVMSLGILIYFIHSIAQSIQADNLVADVADELSASIERLYPEKLGEDAPEQDDDQSDIPKRFEEECSAIRTVREGYIQAIESETVMQIATENGLLLKLELRPGAFVHSGAVLLKAWPADECPNEIGSRLCDAFLIGKRRTPTQNAEYCIEQLAEVAVRSLSPGINDPYSAMSCIDRLGSALAQIAQRRIPSPLRYDEKGNLRVIAARETFGELAESALGQIRLFGSRNSKVVLRMLETLRTAAQHVRRQEDIAVLKQHLKLIQQEGLEHATNDQDAQRITRTSDDVLGLLTR